MSELPAQSPLIQARRTSHSTASVASANESQWNSTSIRSISCSSPK